MAPQRRRATAPRRPRRRMPTPPAAPPAIQGVSNQILSRVSRTRFSAGWLEPDSQQGVSNQIFSRSREGLCVVHGSCISGLEGLRHRLQSGRPAGASPCAGVPAKFSDCRADVWRHICVEDVAEAGRVMCGNERAACLQGWVSSCMCMCICGSFCSPACLRGRRRRRSAAGAARGPPTP